MYYQFPVGSSVSKKAVQLSPEVASKVEKSIDRLIWLSGSDPISVRLMTDDHIIGVINRLNSTNKEFVNGKPRQFWIDAFNAELNKRKAFAVYLERELLFKFPVYTDFIKKVKKKR